MVLRTIERLVRGLAPERIVLFGSYAKGRQRAGSDVDLLLIGPFDARAAHAQRRARQLAASCFPPIDIVLATPQEVADAPRAKSPFLHSILGTGVTVYTRDA